MVRRGLVYRRWLDWDEFDLVFVFLGAPAAAATAAAAGAAGVAAHDAAD